MQSLTVTGLELDDFSLERHRQDASLPQFMVTKTYIISIHEANRQ